MRWPLMVFLVVLTLALLPLEATLQNKDGESETVELQKKEKIIKDKKVLDSIEKNLMGLFGFSKRPRPNRKDIVIPKALLDLYKKQTGMDIETTSFMLPGRLTSSANTVRSFTHEGKDVISSSPLRISLITYSVWLFLIVGALFELQTMQLKLQPVCW